MLRKHCRDLSWQLLASLDALLLLRGQQRARHHRALNTRYEREGGQKRTSVVRLVATEELRLKATPEHL